MKCLRISLDMVSPTGMTELETDNQPVRTCDGILPSRSEGINCSYVSRNLDMETPVISERSKSASTPTHTSTVHEAPTPLKEIYQLLPLYTFQLFTKQLVNLQTFQLIMKHLTPPKEMYQLVYTHFNSSQNTYHL